MSSIGIQALLLPLLGIHSALTHQELMGLFEITRGLRTSYRFASSEPGAGALYGRFTLNFCRIIAGGVTHYASMERSIDETAAKRSGRLDFAFGHSIRSRSCCIVSLGDD